VYGLSAPGDLEAGAELKETEAHFRHEVLFYSGEHEFLRGTLPFIGAAVAAEEPILIAVSNARIALLKEALGDLAEVVCFADMRELGRNPACIIPAWGQFLEENLAAGRSIRGIGEPIWPGRSAAELSECERYESLLNLAFGEGHPWRLVCPYDLERLDDHVIETARRNHPFVTQEDGGGEVSGCYLDPSASSGPFDGPLPQPPSGFDGVVFGGEDVSALRTLVTRWAADAQLGSERIERLVLAVSELATNSVRYGGGRGELRMWIEAELLFCEVHDSGRIQEPLAGRVRPTPDQHAGRGLWLVNQLCDLVQIRSSPRGSVVRVHMSTQ
jgi:anti-sigma regulatory factor (Ser/Thr protein kinase)